MTIPRAASLYSKNNGTTSSNVPEVSTRDPSSSDISGKNGQYPIGQTWINNSTGRISVLLKLICTNGIVSAVWEDIVNGPSGIGTINTISPDITGNFTITAGEGVTITPGTNEITIASGADGILTLNTIEPDGSGNFTILAGAGVTITPGTNEITIGSAADGILTLNGIAPDEDGNFTVSAGEGVTITPDTNGITIASGADGILTINDIAPDGDGNFTLSAGSGITLTPGTNEIVIAAGSGDLNTLSDDENNQVTPNGGNIQLVGHVVEQAGSPAKFSTVVAGANLLNINPMSASRWIVDPLGFNGTHTTISDALTDATSGDTVVLLTGTYTEDVTLKPGVNIVAHSADAYTPNVVINGTCLLADEGVVSISGVNLVADTDPAVQVNSTGVAVLNLINCYISVVNGIGVDYSSVNPDSSVSLNYCNGDIVDGAGTFFSNLSSGSLNINSCSITNSGGSIVASITSDSITRISSSYIEFSMSTIDNGIIEINNSLIDLSANNAPCLSLNSAPNCSVTNSTLRSGESVVINLDGSSSLQIYDTVVDGDNNPVITGTGGMTYSGIIYPQNNNISPSVSQGKTIDLGQYRAKSQTAFLYYLENDTTPDLTGDGTVYQIGTDAFISSYDQTSACTTACVFTVQDTGIYTLGCTLTVQNVDPSHDIGTVYIQIGGGNSYTINIVNPGSVATSAGLYTFQGTTQVSLTQGDVITWQLQISGHTKTIGLVGVTTPVNTSIFGYQLA